MRAKMFGILGCLLMLIAAGSAQAALIDTFDLTDHWVDKTTTHAEGVTNLVTPEAIGDYRKLDMVSVTGPGNAKLQADGPYTLLALSNDLFTSSNSTVTWDGDAVGSGLGGVDLTDLGLSTYLSIEISGLYLGGLDIKFWITDNTLGTASVTMSPTGTGIYQLPFSSFTDYQLGIFQSVDKIVMELQTVQPDADLGLDFVYTSGAIPEPSTIILLGLGGLGMLGYVWRSRRKNS